MRQVTEKLAQKMLEDEGFLVEKPNWSRWGNKDFFNLWDLIATNKNSLRFIQVSSVGINRGSHKNKDFAGFPCPKSCTKEYWFWNKKTEHFDITIL